ncbi:MAG: rhodanese-like domain-containing protein [Myxococcales bacterium]|nr:rhodanese-like domain-containing protein [Myxococcales bacterium]
MLIRLFAFAFVLVLVPRAARAEEADPFGKLAIEDVEKRLSEKGFFLYDNNQPAVFKEGHLPKAKWVDYKNLSAKDLPTDKEATLVFYCANEH